jgi:hypothetical protein
VIFADDLAQPKLATENFAWIATKVSARVVPNPKNAIERDVMNPA